MLPRDGLSSTDRNLKIPNKKGKAIYRNKDKGNDEITGREVEP